MGFFDGLKKIGAVAAGGITGAGWVYGQEQKKAQQDAQNRALSYGLRGANLMAPSTADFQGQFSALQGFAAPMLNQIAASQGLAGQQAAYGIQGSLGRAGLGSTGLGTALASGAQAGAAFQGNVLRARILQDLLGQTSQIQQARGSTVAGVPVMPITASGMGGALNALSGALQVAGSMQKG